MHNLPLLNLSVASCRYIHAKIFVETTGVLGPAAAVFLSDVGRRITEVTGDPREVAWLRQRISLAIVRGNAAAVLATTAPRQEGNACHDRLSAPLGKGYLSLSSSQHDLASRQEKSGDTDPDLSHESGVASAPDVCCRGLVNLGNTCYMNAVIQTLFHTDQFCREVLMSRPRPERPHITALQRVFAFLAFSDRPSYSPAGFQTQALPPWFDIGRQQDGSELLTYLLDSMHTEVGETSSRDSGASLVHRLLTIQIETSFTCSSCGITSRHLERTQGLHLALPASTSGKRMYDRMAVSQRGTASPPVFGQQSGSPTEDDLQVTDLLDAYLSPERLDEDNQYRCSTCDCLRDADRQLHLLDLPLYLVVSLTRMVFNRHTGALHKNTTPVSLTEYISVPLSGQPAMQYMLYATIFHAGPSPDTGHYFSICRRSDGDGGRWHRLDDTTVTTVSTAAALGQTQSLTDVPYTLLFRRIDDQKIIPQPLPQWAELPAALRAEVLNDNEVFRRERHGLCS